MWFEYREVIGSVPKHRDSGVGVELCRKGNIEEAEWTLQTRRCKITLARR
jgi:hypothetical protein